MSRASGSRRVIAIAAVAAVLAAASLVFAQQIWVGGYRGYGSGGARFAKMEDFDGTFLYCRGYYQSPWQAAGGARTTLAPTTISPSGSPSSRAFQSSSTPTSNRITS